MSLYTYTAQIVSVYDGDTVHAIIDLGFGITTGNPNGERLRLAAINAPELHAPGGMEAAAYFAALIGVGTTPSSFIYPAVLLHTVRDRADNYGRYLCYLYPPDAAPWDDSDTPMVGSYNAAMLAAGHAVPYPS